jgi:hypothetical protein
VADLLGAMLEQGCMTVRPPGPPQWAFDPPRLPFGITFPSPRAATIGVLGMLAFGVIIGSTVSPNWAELPAASPLLLAVRPHVTPLANVTSAAENSLAGGGRGRRRRRRERRRRHDHRDRHPDHAGTN